MKKAKSLMSLLLVLLMLASVLAGCTGSTEPAETVSQPSETESTDTDTAEADEPVDAAEPETTEVTKPDTSVCWRSEEPETLSIFWAWPSIISKFVPDPNDLPSFKAIEELTNVTMELYVVADDVASEKRNLMVAAGDLPDIVPNLAANYTGGGEQAVEDDVLIDIAPYIEEYCPNYNWYLTQEFPDVYDDVVTKSGYLSGFAGIFNQEQRSDQGCWIRQDWLDELGLEVPETPDEFYEVLKAFKAAYDCTDAYCLMPQLGMMINGDLIMNAFGRVGTYRVDDTIYYGILDDDGPKELLQFLAKLYSEGLVNANFMSYVENTVADGVVESNNCGVFQQDVSYIANYSNTVDDDNFRAVAIAPLVSEKGSKSGYLSEADTTQGETCIAYNTEKLELALRWCDCFYSDPVAAIANYGKEGVTYTVDENGKVQYTDLVTNNPDGIPQPLVIGIYGLGAGSMGFLIDLTQKYIDFTDDQYASHDIWKSVYDGDYNLIPSDVNDYYTAAEQSEQSSIQTDVDTAMEEIIFKLIVGEASFDDWDTYVEQIANVGAQQLKETSQEKYNEWLADQQ